MTFNSLQFAALLAVVLLLYYRFGVEGQNRLMFVAGTVFYGAFDWRFLGLLYLSTIVDYLVGRGLDSERPQSTRKLLLATSLTAQLGILAVFKYFNFFADSFTRVARQARAVARSRSRSRSSSRSASASTRSRRSPTSSRSTAGRSRPSGTS